MHCRTAILALMLLLCFSSYGQRPAGYKVIAYYTGNGELIRQYPVKDLTHIIYSFLRLKNDTLVFANTKQEATVKQLVSLKKQNPGLKIMVSIGGWGGCAPCSGLFASDAHRKMFARTTVALFRKYGIDGLDLDWEYPAIEGYPGHAYTPEDREHFTAVVRTLRKEMGNDFLLSFAAGGFVKYLEESIDWDAMVPEVDFINLMTYDLTNGYSKVTGHHTPLFSTVGQFESTDRCVSWLTDHQVPPAKLIIGAAFYARVWEQVPDSSQGLYQPGKFKRGVNYKNFTTYFGKGSGFQYHWDDSVRAPYQYNPTAKLFATFDDKRSIAEKCRYVIRRRLGGIMFWELSLDQTANGLVNTMVQTLSEKNP